MLTPADWTAIWYKCLVCQRCFQHPKRLIFHKQTTPCGPQYPDTSGSKRNATTPVIKLEDSDSEPDVEITASYVPPDLPTSDEQSSNLPKNTCTTSSNQTQSISSLSTECVPSVVLSNSNSQDYEEGLSQLQTNDLNNENELTEVLQRLPPPQEDQPSEAQANDFRCRYCYNKLATLTGFKHHVLSHNKRRTYHNCYFCGIPIRRYDVLVIHLRLHTGERPYGCECCGRSFPSRAGFSNHECEKLGCPHCGKQFTKQRFLRGHILGNHELVNPIVCKICDMGFVAPQSLQKHLTSNYHRRKLRRLQIFKRKFAQPKKCISKLPIIQANVNDEEQSQPATILNKELTICPNSSTSGTERKSNKLPTIPLTPNENQQSQSSTITSPNSTHTNINYCQICNRSFSCAPNLKSHMESKSHRVRLLKSNIRKIRTKLDTYSTKHNPNVPNPSKCIPCNVQLAPHPLSMYQHNKTKMHKMNTGAVIPNSKNSEENAISPNNGLAESNLMVETKTQRVLKCNVCKVNVCNLNRHYKTKMHLTESAKITNSIECQTCFKKFKHIKGLRRHERYHNKLYHCIICALSFGDSHDLNRHLGSQRHKWMEKSSNNSRYVEMPN